MVKTMSDTLRAVSASERRTIDRRFRRMRKKLRREFPNHDSIALLEYEFLQRLRFSAITGKNADTIEVRKAWVSEPVSNSQFAVITELHTLIANTPWRYFVSPLNTYVVKRNEPKLGNWYRWDFKFI